MIKVEHAEVWGFEHAIRGMRNPLCSWERSDSEWDWIEDESPINPNDPGMTFVVGENDLALMRKLYKAGPEHRKYLRQIFVSMDVTAPLYWISELDTYKVGTTRNSCSFMHKGTSKQFDITDFSVHDERVYEVLSPLEKKEYELKYVYDTDEYKIYTVGNGRKYRVYKNGKIKAEPFSYTDTMGRTREFGLTDCKPSKYRTGYYYLNIGGSSRERWLLHRLVASVWIENPDNKATVNHIDGDKGNNCVENLEWMDIGENTRAGYESGLFDRVGSAHARYISWKNGHKVVSPFVKTQILKDHENGLTYKGIASKYNITDSQASNIISSRLYKTENEDLFRLCYVWDTVLDSLNELRLAYLETKDEQIFQQIRCLLPCGYNQRFTITMNYENVFNIIRQRRGHRLTEWDDFISELLKLPYVKEIGGL